MSLAHATPIVKHPGATRDAFLGGRITLLQPERGFRAGLDSVLLGTAVGRHAGRLLDLGAGVGTAALVALAHWPGLRATLAESDLDPLTLASRNIADNGFSGRAETVAIDVTASGKARAAAGLAAGAFTSVIANPPFFEGGTAASRRGKVARQMPAADIETWVRTAAAHATADAEIVFVHTTARLRELLDAFAVRFGAITILPLIPHDGEPSHRVLVRGIKGSRAPLSLLASRALHDPAGRAFRPEFEAIFRGEDTLHW